MTVGRRLNKSSLNLLAAATRIGLLVGLPLLAESCSGSTADSNHLPNAIAILDVNVIPMDSERVLRNQTIVARNGLITAVGATGSVAVPSGAQTVDGSGKYVLPGLTDFHVHLRDTTELLSYLAHGVTTVVHLSGPMGNVPDVLELRRRISEGDILGPTVYTSGRILDGDPPINPGVSIPVSTPENARRIVAQQVDAGVDLI